MSGLFDSDDEETLPRGRVSLSSRVSVTGGAGSLKQEVPMLASRETDSRTLHTGTCQASSESLELPGVTNFWIMQRARSLPQAEKLLRDGAIFDLCRDADGAITARVKGSLPDSAYMVRARGWTAGEEPSAHCVCEDFAQRGGLCKHGAALLLALVPGCGHAEHLSRPVSSVPPDALSTAACAPASAQQPVKPAPDVPPPAVPPTTPPPHSPQPQSPPPTPVTASQPTRPRRRLPPTFSASQAQDSLVRSESAPKLDDIHADGLPPAKRARRANGPGPRKPLTAQQLFLRAPKADGASKWKDLSPEERAPFVKAAAEDRARCEVEAVTPAQEIKEELVVGRPFALASSVSGAGRQMAQDEAVGSTIGGAPCEPSGFETSRERSPVSHHLAKLTPSPVRRTLGNRPDSGSLTKVARTTSQERPVAQQWSSRTPGQERPVAQQWSSPQGLCQQLDLLLFDSDDQEQIDKGHLAADLAGGTAVPATKCGGATDKVAVPQSVGPRKMAPSLASSSARVGSAEKSRVAAKTVLHTSPPLAQKVDPSVDRPVAPAPAPPEEPSSSSLEPSEAGFRAGPTLVVATSSASFGVAGCTASGEAVDGVLCAGGENVKHGPEVHAGARVRIAGVQGRPEFNGQVGVAAKLEVSTSRWVVKMADGTGKNLRVSNLEVVAEPKQQEKASVSFLDRLRELD